MALEWGTAEFVPVSDAVAVDHGGIAITAVIRDETTIVSWAINAKGLSWSACEVMARDVAERINEFLAERYDVEFTPDEG